MAPEAEPDEAEYVPGQRSQEWLHLAHVEFIEAEYDIDLNKLPANEVIAIAFATRRDYRASEIYSDAKEAHAAEVAKEAAKAEREAAREEREAARAKAKEEKEAAKAKAEKTAEKATKGTAKKATAASKKSAASRRRAKEAEAEDADPFED